MLPRPRPKLPPHSTPIHPHPSVFAFSWFEGAETAPGPQTNWPPLGRESCWGSAVSEPCPRRCFRSRIHGAAQGRYIKRSTAKASTSTPIHPLFAFSWFEGAETAPGPQSYWPPLGLESCWGSAVSEPCPRRCFCSRTITSRLAKCFASICVAACPTVLRNGPCRSLLYPDSCWTSFPIRLLVFALNSSRSFRWLHLRATAGASMGERTYHVAISNTKLLAAVPCDVHRSRANDAISFRLAVGAFVLILFRRLAFP